MNRGMIWDGIGAAFDSFERSGAYTLRSFPASMSRVVGRADALAHHILLPSTVSLIYTFCA
jgi:hypothetical protein